MSENWLFGLHAVQTILKTNPGQVHELRLLRGRQDQRRQKLQALAEKQQIPLLWVSRKELEALAPGNHQGVAARCTTRQVRDEQFLFNLLDNLQDPPFLLVLDCITDPHNLGAILRSADAAGVQAVIAPKDRSVGITPIVSKVACGAAETVPFVVVTNLARTLHQLREQGIWITGAAGEAETLIYQADLTGPIALVMGAEGEGLRQLTRKYCDLLARLPMRGEVSSLNVSVATGICLFEAVRQRCGVLPKIR